MTETTYNGWTNYETWNVKLWVDNDEGLYQQYIDWLQRRQYPVDGPVARVFGENLFPNGTPDMNSFDDMLKVNWDEIAEHWEEERQDFSLVEYERITGRPVHYA